MNPHDQLRHRFSAFTPLTDGQWLRFLTIVEPVTYAKNDFLLEAGQVEQYIYFLNEGMIRLALNNDGKDVFIDFVFSPDFRSA